MEDLNARTESVIGDSTDENDEQAEDKIVTGDPEVDDEPEELKEEQAYVEAPELPLEPDDPE